MKGLCVLFSYSDEVDVFRVTADDEGSVKGAIGKLLCLSR